MVTKEPSHFRGESARTHDVIIIGAGPAGSYTASLLKDQLDILIIEEHETAGGKPCTGLISTNLEKFTDVKDEWIENKVCGASIHLPSGKSFKVEKDKIAAYVIDRDKFDKHLAKQVESYISFNTKAKYLKIRRDCVEVKTNKGVLKSKMVVGADGINSVVRKHFGQKPKEIVNGLIAFTDEADASDHVHIYLDKKLISDGFLWKVPRGRRTEYGALGTDIDFRLLEKFFRLKNYVKQAHPIPIGPNRTYFEKAILIGDAAGITQPWSGGGVIYGLMCSKIAAEVIVNYHHLNPNGIQEVASCFQDPGTVSTGLTSRSPCGSGLRQDDTHAVLRHTGIIAWQPFGNFGSCCLSVASQPLRNLPNHVYGKVIYKCQPRQIHPPLNLRFRKGTSLALRLKAFKENDFSENFLKEYEAQWKKLLWKNIKTGLLLRKLLKISSNASLEAVFSALGRMDLSGRDMDLPF